MHVRWSRAPALQFKIVRESFNHDNIVKLEVNARQKAPTATCPPPQNTQTTPVPVTMSEQFTSEPNLNKTSCNVTSLTAMYQTLINSLRESNFSK